MKRLTKNIGGLLLVATATYFLAMLVLCKLSTSSSKLIHYVVDYIPRKGGQEMYMLADYDAQKDWDVLVLGSSHAYRGYDPRIFERRGYQMFNAGSSAQSPEITLHLVNKHLKIGEGQLVILDVYPLIFTLEGKECKWRWIVHDDKPSDALSLAFSSPDFRSINTLVKRLICENEGKEYDIEGYISNGYCSRTDTVDFDFKFDTQPFEPLPEMSAYFQELVNTVKNKGAQLVLVNHPMPEATKQPDITSYLDSLGIDAPYLDFSHAEGFGLEYFGDPSHLNQPGVEKFNKILIEELEERGYLEP